MTIYDNTNILSFVKECYGKNSKEYELIKNNIDKYDTDFCTSDINEYFNEIKKIPRLSLEEQEKYLAEYLNGSKEAKKTLITSNLYYVFLVALGYIGNGVSLEDLIQEGNIGLMKAVNSMNPSNKDRYITQINCYVNYYIRDYIDKVYKNSQNKKRLTSRQSVRIIDHYQKQIYSNDSIETICREFAKTNSEILKFPNNDISFNIQLNDETTLEDIIYDNSLNPESIFIENENELLPIIENSNLTKTQKKYIITRFGLLDNKYKSKNQTARIFNVSPEAVRCTHLSAIKRLKINNQIVELYGDFYNHNKRYEELKNEIEKIKMSKRQIYLTAKKQLWIQITNNIYYLFPNSSKNKIDMALSSLSKEDMNMLEKIFKNKDNKLKEELFIILNKLSYVMNGVNYIDLNQEKKVDIILHKNNSTNVAKEKANAVCNAIRVFSNLNNNESTKEKMKKYLINIKCKPKYDDFNGNYYSYYIIVSEKNNDNTNIVLSVNFDLKNLHDGLKIIVNTIKSINEGANKIVTTFDKSCNSIIQNNSNIKIVTQINSELENKTFVELHKYLKEKSKKNIQKIKRRY